MPGGVLDCSRLGFTASADMHTTILNLGVHMYDRTQRYTATMTHMQPLLHTAVLLQHHPRRRSRNARVYEPDPDADPR